MKYELHYNGSMIESANARQWREFATSVALTIGQSSEASCQIFIDRKLVSFSDLLAHEDQLQAEFEAKRNLTHRPVWVHRGASNLPSTWHKKWVRR